MIQMLKGYHLIGQGQGVFEERYQMQNLSQGQSATRQHLCACVYACLCVCVCLLRIDSRGFAL